VLSIKFHSHLPLTQPHEHVHISLMLDNNFGHEQEGSLLFLKRLWSIMEHKVFIDLKIGINICDDSFRIRWCVSLAFVCI
jgi:hypothetical protein